MKYLDIDKLDDLPGIQLKADDSFSFRCYPGIGCFNQCCRNLNLFLYPYDVLRLKNGLGISSNRFLDEYVDVVMRQSNYFPEVLLRMSDDKEKSCIFMTDSGCSTYEHRPDTCRNFPVEQGMIYNAETNKTDPVSFFRPPDFCLGANEDNPLTPDLWARDQERDAYNKWMIKWMEIKRLFQTDPWGVEGPEGQKAKMAFMATYNIDSFRDFILNSSFLKRYQLKSTVKNRIKKNDEELLKLGFAWVRFFVWGIKSKMIRIK